MYISVISFKKIQQGPCGHKFVANDYEKKLNVSFYFFSFVLFYMVTTTKFSLLGSVCLQENEFLLESEFRGK